MKIDNLTSYPAGSRFEADVVIVGGGPAGLTVAREFTNSEAKILILEAGLRPRVLLIWNSIAWKAAVSPKAKHQ